MPSSQSRNTGCTDPQAINYESWATEDDGSCYFCTTISDHDCDWNCNLHWAQCSIIEYDGDDCTWSIGNGACGCTDDTACNYDGNAIEDNGTCTSDPGCGCDQPPAEDYYDCDGNCLIDTDGDNVCDELEISGCTHPQAINYESSATEDDGSCYLCTTISDPDCDWNCNLHWDQCSIIEYDGDDCTWSIGNGACGCTDDTACNYDGNAIEDNGTCTSDPGCGCDQPPAEDYYDCDGNCLIDTDGDNVCDELEISGCTDPQAINYESWATEDDGSCYFCTTISDHDCDWNCNLHWAQCSIIEYDGDDCTWSIGNGACGCTDDTACNYDGNAIEDNGTCTSDPGCGCDQPPAEDYYDCEGNCLIDTDGDSVCDELEISGCTDPQAINYESWATEDDGSCYFCTIISDPDCDWNCNLHWDQCSIIEYDGDDCTWSIGNGACGCTDDSACNYDGNAIEDNGTCTSDPGCGCDQPPAEDYYDCEGNCLIDTDGDSVCDELEISGCTDPQAINYESWATEDDGSCYFCTIISDPDCDWNCNLHWDQCSIIEYDGDDCTWSIGNGACGCTDDTACNYDGNAIEDNGTCTSDPGCGCDQPPAEDYYDCEGNCLIDTDGDSVCDELEISGCTDPQAINYESWATEDDGSCYLCTTISDPDCDWNCNLHWDQCSIIEYDGDDCTWSIGNGACGCTDDTACNYDGNAIEDNGTCTFECVCTGDLNNDDVLNILDIIMLVNVVLGLDDTTACTDLTGDGSENILDIVTLVNRVLNPSREDNDTSEFDVF